MNKELFIDTLQKLKKQMEYDSMFADNLNKCFPNAFSGNLLYENGHLFDAVLDILIKETNDRGNWIDYFVYELEFGKNPADITYGDKKIKLDSIEALWEILQED